MIEDVRQIEAEALAQLEALAATATPTMDEVNRLAGSLLGKKSAVTAAKARLGGLEPEERREAGRLLNEARETINQAVSVLREQVQERVRRERLEAERLDLTETIPERSLGRTHLVTQATDRLIDVFVGMGFTVAEGPEIESDWYNFGALNFPEGHTARDMYDTLYVDVGEPGSTLLRTHTSPVQVRVMENQEPPIYIVAPGRVFRRDTADATHMPVFHQIEGLVIDRGITFGDLAGTIDAFTTAFLGSDWDTRLRPAYFPFTEPSAEFDVRTPAGDWMELGGCGMVHPNVLANCGIDPEEWSGFAFGFGIDRFAKQDHGVDDLRELFTNDIRFLEQF